MKQYKIIDYWTQVLLITGSLFYCLCIDNDFTLYAYLLVGGWQLVSCLVHAVYKKEYYPAHDRRFYLKTLLWVLIMAIITLPLWLYFWFGMLFISPFLAGWYVTICYTENKILARKSFLHLK